MRSHYRVLYKDLSESIWNHYDTEEDPGETQTIYLTGKEIELILFVLDQQMRRLSNQEEPE